MILCQVIILLTLIAIPTSTMNIPDELWCCSPELGVFQHINSSRSYCWHEMSNKTNPLRLTCPYNTFLRENFNVNITESGQVFLLHPQLDDESSEMDRATLCFANFTKWDKILNVIVSCDEEKDPNEDILGYCMSISALFLLLTSAVYAALPEIRDLQGKSIINFCGSMGIGLGTLGVSNLMSYTDMTWCAIRGFTIYFFLMAAFFWSSALSVQILLSLRRPVVNNYSWKEFGWYALYAWGCPTILTMCMAIVNFHPGDHKKPGIGLNNCWFYSTRQQWYYMYGELAILVTINIFIFIYISLHMWRLSFSSSHVKALRYKFVMTLRMFLIMGVSWIFEMISSITEHSVMWFIIDMFNTLQGPLIFLLLVVLRKRVVKALLRRGCLGCVAGPVERYLAVKEDDEEGVIQHTLDVTMNDRNGNERN